MVVPKPRGRGAGRGARGGKTTGSSQNSTTVGRGRAAPTKRQAEPINEACLGDSDDAEPTKKPL